jgi:hypothetical protein
MIAQRDPVVGQFLRIPSRPDAEEEPLRERVDGGDLLG